MFSPIPEPIKHSLDGASKEVKDLLGKILAESILSSSLPEEHKIEIRIMTAFRDFQEVMNNAYEGFANPIPPTEEGEAFAKEIYPSRQEFLEYLQLMKAGLDSFLAANPIPEIPPEVRSAMVQFDR